MTHTLGPWGIEQTRDMLWVGPMRSDGRKVDVVVVGLNTGPEMTMEAALRQYRNARLIAAAPELLEALAAWVESTSFDEQTGTMGPVYAAAVAAIAKVRGAA